MADAVADTLQILEPLFACIDGPHRIVRLMSVSKAWKSGALIWFRGLRRLVNRWQSPLSDETPRRNPHYRANRSHADEAAPLNSS